MIYSWKKSLTIISAAVAGIVVMFDEVGAQTAKATNSTNAAAHAPGPVLVELFTSQGCSSCPPAERLFSELSKDPNLVSIEWHVDYWDNLVHGGSNWKDPYSSADNTRRQRAYNGVIRKTRGVYTPQAVVGGMYETTGFDENGIHHSADLVMRAPNTVSLKVDMRDGEIIARLDGEGEARVQVVTLLETQSTRVLGGENKGRLLKGRHIGLAAMDAGYWEGGEAEFSAAAPGKGETCAVIVQEGSEQFPGQVLAAQYCPKAL